MVLYIVAIQKFSRRLISRIYLSRELRENIFIRENISIYSKFTINNAHYLKFGYIIWKFILQSQFILYLQSFQVIIIIKNINLFNSSLILVTKK